MYAAILNVPGYSPMDDDPPVFDTPEEAWQHHVGEVNLSWDNHPEDENGACLQAHTALHNIDQSQPGVVYAPTPGYEGDHDLGLAYCVVAVEEEGPPEAYSCHCGGDPAHPRSERCGP